MANVSSQSEAFASRLSGRSVLVTGASGFIGSHLSARPVEAGAVVHGISRQLRASSEMQWHRADLSKPEDVARVCDQANPDVVFHLASYVAGTRDPSAVFPTLQSNCMSAVNLMLAAQERRFARLVLAGSLEEAQEGEAPSSPYAAAKGAASGYARMFHKLYGTPIVNARIFMVYGPDQPDHSKLVPYVTLSLLRAATPRLSSGSRLVDWIYIDDLVAGLVALGTAPGIEGETIDLGSGKLSTIADVVRELHTLITPGKDPAFGTLPDRAFEIERVADTCATARRTGWTPKTLLSEGLRQTVDFYRRVEEGERSGGASGAVAGGPTAPA